MKGSATKSSTKSNSIKIEGWGIDADPKNEPTYPIKNYTGDDHKRQGWIRPSQQHQTVEILKSNERPSLSAVFGTSVPPKGLSGIIRRFAFKYSESSYFHWLPLILADRINVIEGTIEDLGSGKIPNLFKEKGGPAAWKYNKSAFITKGLVQAFIITSIGLLIYEKNRAKKRII